MSKQKKDKIKPSLIPKKKKRHDTSPSLISEEQVEEMFRYYCSGMSVAGIAKKLNTTASIVNRYIKKGDSRRSIKPLEARKSELYADIRSMTNEKIESIFKDLLSKIHSYVNIVGDRWVDRIQRAQELDNIDLYKEGNEALLKATQEKALNPNTKDVVEVIKALKDLGTILKPEQGTVVNVQTQTNTQVNVSKEDIKEYFDGQFSKNVQANNREDLDALIERKSLEMDD